MPDTASLSHFLSPVREWFRSTHGSPSPPQLLGWPSIRGGNHTLILAPTGSGKTLAAFLACLDQLWRDSAPEPGVRVLYISPLKALNEDVARNLEAPIAGIEAEAARLGSPLRHLRHAVRTGDTPPAQRQAIARRPPEILITTPESLHLLLGSRARAIFAGLTHVIVDEIHALCPNKRGVFLSILLERLAECADRPFVRIGLSATQRPLGMVARYLGGQEHVGGVWRPRPVRIVDTGTRKSIDLRVSFPPPERVGDSLQPSVWPGIESRLLDLIRDHRSTIVFANNRRVVERLTNRLNELASPDLDAGETPPEVVRSHHGSLSLDQRRSTEIALKEGRLPAVVATASLELGIDMGAVELVCQVESPGSVSRGLQRVGRAGHLVGQSSKGRLFAKSRGDLLETAALAHAMLRGEVEELRVPSLCLDLLAQQIVACVATGPSDALGLLDLFRRSYCYRDLSVDTFEQVLSMVSGRLGLDFLRDLRPRISWDRVHNRLEPLPGTSQLALTSGGAIPDTGQYAVVMGPGGPRLGELDEEFVLERQIGDVFVLGTSTWKIDAIEPDRVIVSPGSNPAALIPFWRGEGTGRTAELGLEVGRLTRLIADRLDDPDLIPLLADSYRLDAEAASALVRQIRRQLSHSGAAPDDRTILVESSRDPAGEWLIAVLSPFGRRFHHALRLVVVARIEERFGLTPAAIHADDGLLLRFPGADDPPLDCLDALDPAWADQTLRRVTMDSAGFGLRFRQNAARALLMPRPQPGKRTPLWLQRLRARDLLQVVRQIPDFPIVLESLRESLLDDLDLPGFLALAARIASGEIRVVKHPGEIPSPFASELILPFTSKFLYEWDDPRPAPAGRPSTAEAASLDALLDPQLRRHALAGEGVAEAIETVDRRLRGLNHPPRTPAEAAEWLRRLGDLAPSEVPPETLPLFGDLLADGRAILIKLPGSTLPDRWILVEDLPAYQGAFVDADASPSEILRRYLRTRALVGLDELVARYPVPRTKALDLLEDWARQDQVVPIGDQADQWADLQNLATVRQQTLSRQRRDSRPVAPETFSRFVVDRQRLTPLARLEGPEGLDEAIEILRGYALPADAWEVDILPARLKSYRGEWLDQLLGLGGWSWRVVPSERSTPLVAFTDRVLPLFFESPETVSDADRHLLDHLRARGASFATDLAQSLVVPASRIQASLGRLIALGLVSNDRFDPLRSASRPAVTFPSRRSRRLRHEPIGEGRWFAVEVVLIATDDHLASWSTALLDRYGLISREIVAQESAAPPWRDLIRWLDRAEWRGEVRRGYFVQGLSGLQYAATEVPDRLRELDEAPRPPAPEVVLLSSLDPANLFGSGAPFDIPLLGGGTARLPRNESTHLALAAGRPVLIIEASGKRLTVLAGATHNELSLAFGLLRTLTKPERRVLKVEAIDDQPAWTSPHAALLAEAGFVREPPAMSLYLGW